MVHRGKNIVNGGKNPQFLPVMCALCVLCVLCVRCALTPPKQFHQKLDLARRLLHVGHAIIKVAHVGTQSTCQQ